MRFYNFYCCLFFFFWKFYKSNNEKINYNLQSMNERMIIIRSATKNSIRIYVYPNLDWLINKENIFNILSTKLSFYEVFQVWIYFLLHTVPKIDSCRRNYAEVTEKWNELKTKSKAALYLFFNLWTKMIFRINFNQTRFSVMKDICWKFGIVYK